MDGLTRRQGPWTITHVPASHSAYDRVLGRMTAWALLVEHDMGWRIVQYEHETEAQIMTPGGYPVGVVDVPGAGPFGPPRHDLLIEALRDWVRQHAADYEEPLLPD